MAERSAPRGWRGIRIAVHSDVRYLGPIRTVIREVAGVAGLGPEVASEVELAVTEGCANVIRHCYGGCEDERIDLALTLREEEFEVRIDDYGTFVDPSRIKGRALDDIKPGGLGVHLMHRVMDEVRYEKNRWGGTRLTMVKRLPAAPPAGTRPDGDHGERDR